MVFTLIRARDDADRSASEAARAKALITDLERQLAAARSEAKDASDAVARAGREAGELKQVGGSAWHYCSQTGVLLTAGLQTVALLLDVRLSLICDTFLSIKCVSGHAAMTYWLGRRVLHNTQCVLNKFHKIAHAPPARNRQGKEGEVAALMGEVGKMRSKIREAEADLVALRGEQQVR